MEVFVTFWAIRFSWTFVKQRMVPEPPWTSGTRLSRNLDLVPELGTWTGFRFGLQGC
jgi:hypothetical protein